MAGYGRQKLCDCVHQASWNYSCFFFNLNVLEVQLLCHAVRPSDHLLKVSINSASIHRSSVVPSGRTRGKGHRWEYRRYCPNSRECWFGLYRWWSMGTGLPETAESPPWRSWKASGHGLGTLLGMALLGQGLESCLPSSAAPCFFWPSSIMFMLAPVKLFPCF